METRGKPTASRRKRRKKRETGVNYNAENDNRIKSGINERNFMKLERVYFSTIAVRLGAAIHMETSIDQVNILVCGWNNQRERRGRSRINFSRRIADENEWRKVRGLPPDYERFMFVDELELFSRYAGYDLTH